MNDIRIELDNVISPDCIIVNLKDGSIESSSNSKYDANTVGRMTSALLGGLCNLRKRYYAEKLEMLENFAASMGIRDYELYMGIDNYLLEDRLSNADVLCDAFYKKIKQLGLCPTDYHSASLLERLRQIDSVEYGSSYILVALKDSLFKEFYGDIQMQGATSEEGHISIYVNNHLGVRLDIRGEYVLDSSTVNPMVVGGGLWFSDVMMIDSLMPLNWCMPFESDHDIPRLTDHITHLSNILHKPIKGTITESILWESKVKKSLESLDTIIPGAIVMSRGISGAYAEKSPLKYMGIRKNLVLNMASSESVPIMFKRLFREHDAIADSCIIIDMNFIRSTSMDMNLMNTIIEDLRLIDGISLVLLN